MITVFYYLHLQCLKPILSMKKLYKYIGSLFIVFLINSCSFNIESEDAWMNKLCEGKWQQELKRTGGSKRQGEWTNQFQFNKDGTFILYTVTDGTTKKDNEGTYTMEPKDEDFKFERRILIKPKTNYWGYSQFPMKIKYDRPTKIFKINYNLNESEWELEHFSNDGKRIDCGKNCN